MSVMVVIRFPVPHSAVAEWASRNGELLTPIIKLFEKHGRISHRAVTSGSEFLDFDEWPSAEAYAAFKAEAGPYIEKFEADLGHRSTDTVYQTID